MDKGCLDIGVVVSLTSLDMMLLILAHALVEMNCQILSLFTKIISSPQKFKRMLPTCTAPPTHYGSLCDPVFTHELPQHSSPFTGSREWGKAVTGTHWSSTNCCHLPTDINDVFFWHLPTRVVPLPMHWRRGPGFYLGHLGHNILLDIFIRNISTTSQRVWVRI